MNGLEAKKLIKAGEIFSRKEYQVFEYGIVIKDNYLGTVFIPRSLSGILGEETDLSILESRNILFKLYDYNEQRHTFLASCRDVVIEKISALKPVDFFNIQIGKSYIGIVEYICKYGVFVNIGSVVGLAPSADPSNDTRVVAGSSVSAVIDDIDIERKRIILTRCSKSTSSNSKIISNPSMKNDYDGLIAELNSLIGLHQIKNDVNGLIGLVKMKRIRESKGLKSVPVSLHLVFTGNPGTGKTTVARILAQLYKEIGVLKKGQLIEVDRSDLVAGYVGQTALKTQEKIKEAMGGILFIDEAYTLAKEGNDFGQEAIDTILKSMEDNRDEFIVIVAGYDEPMQKFINSNPGLKSRFNKYFHFPDYSSDELIDIFKMMIRQYDYTITDDAMEAVITKIEEMESKKGNNFANARDVGCIPNSV